MERLNLVYFSSIINCPIVDEFDEPIGVLKDIYVNKGQGYPKVIGYKVLRSGDIYNYEFKNIEFYEHSNGKVDIEVRGVRDIIPQRFSFLLTKDIMNTEVKSPEGKGNFIIRDVRLADINSSLRVLAVDRSDRPRMTSSPWQKFKSHFTSNKDRRDALILWDDVLRIQGKLKDGEGTPYEELASLHPADLADVLEEVEENYRTSIFENLDEELAADTIEEMNVPAIQANVLSSISDTKAGEILDLLPNDEIAEILEELSDDDKDRLMSKLVSDDASEVKEIMGYAEEEAGSIMAKEFVALEDNLTVGETKDLLKELSEEYDADELYYLFVTDGDDVLKGFIRTSDLLLHDDDETLDNVMDPHVEEINTKETAVTAVDLAIKYELLQIPVVDDDGHLVGVINIHDIIDDFLAPLWKKIN